MINRIRFREESTRRITRDDFEKNGLSGRGMSGKYLLIHRRYLEGRVIVPLTAPTECYCIFWQVRNTTEDDYTISSALTFTKESTSIPIHEGILVTFGEIRDIHKDSRYVLPEDITYILEEVALHTSHRALALALEETEEI
jgi:hypothetical protein